MIIKSFFRKKITKIYLIIALIIITAIFLLFSFIDYYSKLESDIYGKYATFVIESDNDSLDLLKKIKGIDSIERVLTFYPDSSYDVLINVTNDYEMVEGAIVSELESGNKISWTSLSYGAINNKIVVVADESLNGNELRIGLMEIDYNSYINNEDIINNTIGALIGFYNEDESIEFEVKELYMSKYPELSISKELFDELLAQEEKYTYRANVVDYYEIRAQKDELIETGKLENQTVVLDVTFYNNAHNTVSQLSEVTNILTIVSYICILIFLLFILITNKNQIFDIKNNVNLERKIGYSKLAIRFNVFKRLFLLYTLAFVMSLVLLLIIFLLVNLVFDVELWYCDVTIIIVSYLVIIAICFGQSVLMKRDINI